MASDTENEMKCSNGNTINIDVYRKLVQTYLKMNLYSTALFWADKVVALSSGAPEDVYWLAQCMYMLKQYHRAAQLVKNRELEKTYVLCNYLVVRCLLEANELAEAMRVLNSLTVDIFQQSLCSTNITNSEGYFDNAPKNIQSAMLVIKGKLFEAMDNRGLAADCFRQALQFDVYCYEAYESLIQHQMLTSSEEQELLESIPISKQCNENEAAVLQMLYESKLKKYHSPSELPMKEFSSNVPAFEEMVCVPSVVTLTSTPHMDHNETTPPPPPPPPVVPPVLQHPVTHGAFTKLQDSLDLMVAQAETFYYNCEYRKCKKITEIVLKRDPYHCECLPVHIACLVELKEANSMFSLAHKLVDLYPHLAISWFAVGCYYYVIGKSDPARRYLSKATSLDRLFGPAWLAFGHSFAVENEHDQAMAVYFKASQLMKGCHLPLLYIGLECGLTNNVRLAEKFFQQAQAIAPRDPFVMHEMGVIAFQTLDYKAAEKYFKQALARIQTCQDKIIVEKWEPLLNNLGHTCRKLKKYDESLDYHHQALSLSPQNPSTYAAIGYTKALMGHTQEAVDWFHKTLGLRRDDTFSTTMLGYVIENLADESQPFPDAPDHIPDFSICTSKGSIQEDDSKFEFGEEDVVPASGGGGGVEESKETSQISAVLPQQSASNMSMSFEVEMPDANGTS